MMMTTTDHHTLPVQRRFGRAARLSLLFALLILLASTVQVVYRAFLPSDGWLSEEDLGGAYWEYHVNLAGAVSASKLVIKWLAWKAGRWRMPMNPGRPLTGKPSKG